jgi:nitroreductase
MESTTYIKKMEGFIMTVSDTLKTIKIRRSIRSFKAEQIKDDELGSVLEAAMYAPSAGNQQAWHFTVIQNKELLDWLNHTAKEAAKQHENEHIRKMAENESLNIFYGAPTLIIVSGNEQAMAIESDCAAANQNMLLAAESIGLGACWINFVLIAFQSANGKEYSKELGIPDGYKPYCSTALGYKKAEAVNAPARKTDLVNYIK